MRVRYPTKRFPNAQSASELRSAVRKSPEWKQLREVIYSRQDGKDILTGQPLRRGWAVHHLREHPDYYDDLTDINFIGLNKTTHEQLHWAVDYADKLDETLWKKYIEIMLSYRAADGEQ